ncbi:MAG: glycosyltransferase family 9 protein [bacterium]
MPLSILIIRLSSLGDIILTTPLVQAIREKYSDARIDFVVKSEFKGIVEQFSWLSNIYTLDTTQTEGGMKDLSTKLQNNSYDHVLDLHNNFRSIKLRRGLPENIHVINKRSFKRWLLVKSKFNLLGNEPDIIGRYFETAIGLGVTDTGGASTFGKVFPKSNQKTVALCPGAKHWNKRWPAEYYTELSQHLIASGYLIHFHGSLSERDYVEEIANQLPNESYVNLCGEISLNQLPEKIAECSFAVTNDSGLMHVAAAVGIQTYSIFGPTVRALGFMPRNTNVTIVENLDLSCRPCTTIGLDTCPKDHFKCMKEITPQMLLEHIDLRISA